MLNFALIGATGRLGSRIFAVNQANPASTLRCVAQINRSNLDAQFDKVASADILIDVSLPEATCEILSRLLKAGRHPKYVIGNTGWKPDQLQLVKTYAMHTAVLLSSNFSFGVQIFMDAMARVSRALGPAYTARIVETHHDKKRDRPSGTAKSMLEKLSDSHKSSTIESIRVGDTIGTHRIEFTSKDETLTLEHCASDRDIFAHGALRATQWLYAQNKSGIYTMDSIVHDLTS